MVVSLLAWLGSRSGPAGRWLRWIMEAGCSCLGGAVCLLHPLVGGGAVAGAWHGCCLLMAPMYQYLIEHHESMCRLVQASWWAGHGVWAKCRCHKCIPAGWFPWGHTGMVPQWHPPYQQHLTEVQSLSAAVALACTLLCAASKTPGVCHGACNGCSCSAFSAVAAAASGGCE